MASYSYYRIQITPLKIIASFFKVDPKDQLELQVEQILKYTTAYLAVVTKKLLDSVCKVTMKMAVKKCENFLRVNLLDELLGSENLVTRI
jgi:hypothetical protein